MARKISEMLQVNGVLIAETPIHVGGLGSNVDVDLALAVDGQGQYYIPGTSLAGALRAWMSQQDADSTNRLWGTSPQAGGIDHASYILIEDGVITTALFEEIRDGVGIDRHLGAAAERVKFSRAILPKGAEIKFGLQLERDQTWDDNQWQRYQTSVFDLLITLREGRIRLGAAKTRGLGQVRLRGLEQGKGIQIQQHKLNSPSGILKALRKKSESRSLPQSSSRLNHKTLTVKIKWIPDLPVMVKSGEMGIAVDILPLTTQRPGEVAFVLPGSSIKGALRTQAERIVRTLCPPSGEPSSGVKQANSRQDFLQQLTDMPLISALFGAPAQKQSEVNALPFGVGALYVEDCHANFWMDASDWAAVKTAQNEQAMQDALKRITPPKAASTGQEIQQAFHVAVDRWTGGAADGFLYSNLEPIQLKWEAITLTLNLNRIQAVDSSDVEPAIVLLLLLLRDLSHQRIPLGYGTNRGMGSIQVKEVSFKVEGLEQPLAKLNDKTLRPGDWVQLHRVWSNPDLLNRLEASWTAWIARATANSNHQD